MNLFDFTWMVGRSVEVLFSDPSTWLFVLGDSLTISVGCPWRLVHRNSIAVSNEDHSQQYGLPVPIDAAARANSLLSNLVVQRVELKDGTADLFIYFDRDCRLEIIPFSSGYESWQISLPSGKSLVAQGGGQLSIW